MKSKIGIFSGFIVGVLLGFLTIVIISNLHPEEDFVGVTIFAVLLSGLFFSLVGALTQRYLFKKGVKKYAIEFNT